MPLHHRAALWLALLACLLASGASASLPEGGTPGRAELTRYVTRYVELSNERRAEDLAALYAADPRVVQDGETLDGNFEEELAANIETWEKYDVSFALETVDRMEVQPERIVLEFTLQGTGKVWAFRVSRSFRKKLVLRPVSGEGWRIHEDITF